MIDSSRGVSSGYGPATVMAHVTPSPRSSTIAWVQTLAIAIGHVLAVAAAHDRAISRYRHDVAVRSQYPMLGVMVVYTVVGLFLLLGV